MSNSEIYSEDRERQGLFQAVALGLDVRDFIAQNPAGRLLMARASDELMAARSALEDVTPSDCQEIIRLQTAATAARNTIAWLGEAIASGNDAEAQLESLEK